MPGDNKWNWLSWASKKNYLLASIILGGWRESDSRETRFAFPQDGYEIMD